MAAGDVGAQIDRNVATITLRNDQRLNAMSMAMWQALSRTLATLAGNLAVRAIILRGDGERAFVSGADISEFGAERSDAAGVAAYDRAVDEAQTALTQFRCPVIAAISGICYGGGLGLSLACDLRYASHSSRFRMPAARLGLGYSRKGVKRMVDMLGAARAGELIYTAQVIDAGQAAQIGLVHSLHDDVFAHAADAAARIAANAPLTVAAAKLAISSVLDGRNDGAADAAVEACFSSDDYAEGRRAFAEKREPRFSGG